jgi:polysaccharide deacetylase family protein (PEP-CTERM system associated)
VLAVSGRLALRTGDPRLLFWLPAVFATLHAGAGVGILTEAIFGRRFSRGQQAGGGRETDCELRIANCDLEIGKNDPQFAIRNSQFAIRNNPPPRNALTFDVEDYFHVTGFEALIPRSQWDRFESRVVPNTYRILAALNRASTRATFFVLGWVANKHPHLVRAIRTAGHDIACHGYWHRLVYQQTPGEFRDDLRRARDLLQDITGDPVTAYRAPSFSITPQSQWALDILIAEGFTVDSSIRPHGIEGPYLLQRPGGELWEFPLPVRRVLGHALPVGGGGYLRLYPYALTSRLLRGINRGGLPFVTYLHPWEMDPDQPRIAAGRLASFRHYVNLGRTAGRLTALLRDFRFGTVAEALRECGAAVASPQEFARAA